MNTYIKEFDRQLTALIGMLPHGWRGFMQALSMLGEPFVVVGAGAAGLLATALRGQSSLEHAFLYALIAFFIGTALKRVVRRDRPNHLDLESFGMKSYSFPSGHAFGSMIIFGLYAYIDARHLLFPWDALSVAIIASVIFLIGVSRVYLRVHYPSDVVGGWLFGIVALIVAVRLA